MSGPVPEHGSRSSQDKRRKRKNRTARNRAPEPKNIISGAGQPLDHSTRRELEERLGHDFSRVRLHTDRDAGELTGLLGADAVAVGQDILFAPGKFRPGTAEGTRLLAHELLHTVQNPHGLGALRAGRDLGEVSLPHQPAEREAESGAREQNPQVTSHQATPGWLRYAKVDADRTRLEVLNPATLVDRLANGLLRSLRGDPEDRSKRSRQQLARMSSEMRELVLNRLESRLLSSEQDRLVDLVEDLDNDGDVERSAMSTPAIEPDLEAARKLDVETRQQEAGQRRQERDAPAEAAGPDKDQENSGAAPGSTPENEGPSEQDESNAPAEGEQDSEQPSGGDAPEKEESEQSGEAASENKSEEKPQDSPEQDQPDGEKQQEQGDKQEASGDEKSAQEEKKEGGEGEKQDQKGEDQQGQDEERKTEPDEEESEAQNREGAVDPLVGGKQDQDEAREGLRGSAKPSGKDEPQPGAPGTLDGVRNQDAEGPQEKPESPDNGGDSEVEVGGGEESAWDKKIRPEDFLPKEDLDVSGVPTADKLEPGAAQPSANIASPAAPPPTKADQIQAERDAEDAEDEAAEQEPDEDTEPPLESDPSIETDTPPLTETASDLATEKATEAASPGDKPKDPKAQDDTEKGPVEAQRAAQDAAGKTEGAKDEPGGAVKESAAKEEKQKPTGDKDAKDTARGTKPEADGKKDAEAEKKESGSETKESEKSTGDSEKQDSGKTDTADTGSPSDSKNSHVSGGKNEQTGQGGDSSPNPPAQEPAPEKQESAKTETPEPRKTEQPARPADPSPKAPAAAEKKDPPKPDVPKPAEEPKPASKKEDDTPAPEPAKSGPAPEAPRRGGGSKGGAGAKPAAKGAKAKKADATPNVAGASPEAGLRTASRLKPHQALKVMGGVDSAVDRTVGDEHQKLSSEPPNTQRPSGAPRTLEGKPKTDAPAEYSNAPAQKTNAPEKKNAEVKDQKKPEGKIPAEEVEEPSGWDTLLMGLGYAIGKFASLFDSDVKPEDLAATFAGMPTQDEALKEAKAGTAPGVEMKGKSDEKTRDQDKKVDGKGEETVKTARDDSGRRMGEDQVYPNAPKEELKGKVPGRERSKGGAKPEGAGTGAVPEDAASEVAEHERGKQFKSSFSKGEQGLADAKRNKDKNTRESKRKHQQSVDSETTKNTGKQSSQRQKTTSEVSGQRDKWRTDQDEELKKLGSKKSDKRTKAERDVDKQEKDTDDKADKRKRDDGDKIRKKGQDAESSAKTKRTETKNESGNWVEEAFEYIKQKFIELRDKILSILREARNKIIEFVENFKFDIEKMINDIRDAIINLITKVIEELVELAKAMVRAIVELANKIRKFITDLIEAAIALVQKLAEQLKQIITDLLNAIAKLLNDILNLLKKAWDAAVKAVKDAVKAVMDFASKLLSGLGQFMMIAADFLRDPGGWLSGLKGSAEDGAQNHLFKQVVGAVKNWFNQKIEEIIGLPKEIFNRLIKGGVTLAWMAKQVWDAIVPQLPFIIGEIVITKVVAKLIPGAGWVLAVIDFLQTAIGALGEIMRAFGAVLTWLKNVRKGGAGVLFAKAVAAGIVAVLELAYEFLLDGIGKYVGKVGDRLKGMAEKIATKGRRKKKPGHGAEGEDSSRGHQRPRQRTNSSGPDNTRPGEGRRDSRGRRSDEGDNGDRRTDERRNDTGRRDNSRDEKDRERQDDRTSPSSAARQAAHKPGGKPGPDRDTAKPERTHNDRGRNENDQDRRRREDNDRDQRPDKDNPDFRDRKPTDRDDSPAAKDKDGNPKGKRDEDKPDTKPTPNAKPKPKADKPQKPREDTGTTKDRQKNDRNEDDTGPKNDDKGTTNRKDDDDPGHEAKDKDSNERKNDDSNDKRERDKDDDRRDKRKNSNSKDNTNKTRPPRRDNRNKAKEDDRERRRIKEDRRGEEESNGFKSARLALIVARIRRALRPRLSQGLPQPLHKGLLRAFRRWYRLTSLVRAGSTRFQDVATLNPSLPVTSGEHSATDEKDYLKIPEDPALPPTRIPDFSDNKLARNFKAEYISKRFVGSHGQTAGKANKQLEPIGFRHLNKYDLNTDSSNRWVRMHLLTERLGGPAKGSNLVPARSRINTNFKNSIEKFPESHVRSGSKKPAWYKIDVNYHNGSVPGFPSHLRAEWGVYEPDPDKQKWKEKPAPHHRSHSRSDLEKPPQPSIENRCYVNHDGKNRIRRMLDVPDSFAKLIVAAVKSKNRNLRSTTQLLRAMDDVHKKRKRSLPNYTNNKQNVIDAAANRHLIFNKKP